MDKYIESYEEHKDSVRGKLKQVQDQLDQIKAQIKSFGEKNESKFGQMPVYHKGEQFYIDLLKVDSD